MPAPGNSLATAGLLTLSANGQPLVQTETVNASQPNDYYQFRLAGRSSFNLSLEGLTGNANVQLLNAGGTVLQTSANEGTLAESINRVLDAGTYYLRVFVEGTPAPESSYSLNVQTQANTQFNLLWRYYGTGGSQGKNLVWQMNETAYQSNVELATLSNTDWHIGGTGDFNNDGHTDILWRYYGTDSNTVGKNVVWYMNGTAYQSSAELLRLDNRDWRIQGTGDFNNDGSVDLLWPTTATTAIRARRRSG